MSLPMVAVAMKTAFAAIGSAGSLVSAGLAVGQAALGYTQAKSEAKMVAASNAQANERARQYMIEDFDSVTRMEQQEAAAASQKINENQIESRKAAASAKVAAGAGGVSGLSVDALLGDIFGQEASIRDSVNQNLKATGEQLQTERNSLQRGFTNTINTRQQPNQPSLLGAGLQAATGVVGAYKDRWKVRGGTLT